MPCSGINVRAVSSPSHQHKQEELVYIRKVKSFVIISFASVCQLQTHVITIQIKYFLLTFQI